MLQLLRLFLTSRGRLRGRMRDDNRANGPKSEIARQEAGRSLTDEECRQFLHVDQCRQTIA